MSYAQDTTVSPEKSKVEIERTLTRYGANAFGYATEGRRAVIQFGYDGEPLNEDHSATGANLTLRPLGRPRV